MVSQAGKSLCTNPQSFLYGVNTVLLLPVQVGGMLAQLVSSSPTWPDFVASHGFSYTYIAVCVCVGLCVCVCMCVVRTLAPPVQSIYILLDL